MAALGKDRQLFLYTIALLYLYLFETLQKRNWSKRGHVHNMLKVDKRSSYNLLMRRWVFFLSKTPPSPNKKKMQYFIVIANVWVFFFYLLNNFPSFAAHRIQFFSVIKSRLFWNTFKIWIALFDIHKKFGFLTVLNLWIIFWGGGEGGAI